MKHEHINEAGLFQSDKYPTCPPGKVPLSTKDPMAQTLLWEYARRREPVDAAFAVDLRLALLSSGYVPGDRPPVPHEENEGLPCPDCATPQKRLNILRLPDRSISIRIAYLVAAEKVASEIKGLCNVLKGFL